MLCGKLIKLWERGDFFSQDGSRFRTFGGERHAITLRVCHFAEIAAFRHAPPDRLAFEE
jgi:hypothetical protein